MFVHNNSLLGTAQEISAGKRVPGVNAPLVKSRSSHNDPSKLVVKNFNKLLFLTNNFLPKLLSKAFQDHWADKVSGHPVHTTRA